MEKLMFLLVLLANAVCFPNDVNPATLKFSPSLPSTYDDDMDTLDTYGSDLKGKVYEDTRLSDVDSSRSQLSVNHEDAFWKFCENPKNNATCFKDSEGEGTGSFQPLKMRIKRDSEGEGTGSFQPLKMRIKRAMWKYNEGAFYDADSCLPTKLKTAEALCTAWPSRVVCNLYCVHGYTFEEGIMRQTVCKHFEGWWSRKFDECKPFIDCLLELTLPGNLSCVTNVVQRPPVCKVDCEADEWNKQMSSKIIQCDAYGLWKPILPFCVEPKGIKLVMPPIQRKHGKVDYPK